MVEISKIIFGENNNTIKKVNSTNQQKLDIPPEKCRLEVKNFNLWFSNNHVLKNINLKIEKNKITAIIGPSGCGKSTFLRSFNRMNDLILSTRIEGQFLLDGINIYNRDIDTTQLRRKVGMVFQKSNPFPKSIFENIAYGLRIQGIKDKKKIKEIVEKSLREAALWDEVKDRLNMLSLNLSGGQQQRLCIARALAVQPEIILFDEPCSALDPIATTKIEELLKVLKNKYTIVIVTHNMQQAARISDYTAFMLLGEIIEYGFTEQIFTSPKDKRTEDYVTGKFG